MNERNYDDIINYDWNYDSLTNRMPLSQRAKIFLPFAALTGYEEALEETLKLEIAGIEGKIDCLF
ncbi:MAG: hypothetical protein II098_07765 [Treponema sp.]|jgi:hypothetical protein|nr:hypothetical protein [Treponema sp.]